MTDAPLPDFLRALPPPTAEQLWARMEQQFSNLADTVRTCRVETREEAIGQSIVANGETIWRDTAPHWRDDEVGMSVRAWNLIPFLKAIDPRDLEARRACAARLVEPLEQEFAKRILSERFLEMWGTFCAAAGAVELIYLAKPDDMASERRGLAKGLAPQRKWVAIQLRTMIDEGRTRQDAEAQIVNRVREILAGRMDRSGFEMEWFKRIVKMKGKDAVALRPAFTAAGQLPSKKLEGFAEASVEVPKTYL